MEKSKKQIYIAIGAFALVLLLGGATYAFFNYTRTGSANVIKTGRIYFNSEQGTAINLTNMFPIDVSGGIPNDNTKVGTVTLNVTGDTTYDEGIEYLVSAVNVQNAIGSKNLPISIDVSVTNNTTNDPVTTLGTSDDSYYDNRGGNSSIYKVLAKDTISNNGELLVGYITKGSTGIDGNIVIKAYLDKAKVAITDTYDGNETDNMGTTVDWVDGRTTFTTEEWNSLQANGVSFQIKVESNEGVWVEEPVQLIESCPGCKFMYYEADIDSQSYNAINPLYYGGVATATNVEDIPDGLVQTDYRRAITNDRKYFLGFTELNGKVDRAFACGIYVDANTNEKTPFCIEGSTDGSTYSLNKIVLDQLYGIGTSSGNATGCFGRAPTIYGCISVNASSVNSSVNVSGRVVITPSSNPSRGCVVGADNTFYCDVH